MPHRQPPRISVSLIRWSRYPGRKRVARTTGVARAYAAASSPRRHNAIGATRPKRYRLARSGYGRSQPPLRPVSASRDATARRTPSTWSRSPCRSRFLCDRRRTPTRARLCPASTRIRPRTCSRSCTCNRKPPRASSCLPRRGKPKFTVWADNDTFATQSHAPKDVFVSPFG